MPITPRLQCWFGETSLAKLLMGVDLEISDGLIKDFQDGQEYIKLLIVLQDIKMWAWRIVFFLVYRWPEFIQHSIWPIFVTLLLLPKEIRTVLGPLMLVGIAPDYKRKEPKSLDVVFKPLIDELLLMNDSRIYDACNLGCTSCCESKVTVLHVLSM